MAMGDADSIFFEFDDIAFEFYAIKVKSLPENRKFDTIKMFTGSRELIYLRPKTFSIPENENLLLRGPKVAAFGEDEVAIIIGDNNWLWSAGFGEGECPKFGIQSVVVKDPEYPEAAVEIIFERIPKPAQAHFNFVFKDLKNKDRDIKITRGVISAISHEEDDRTKRVLRCFGDDLMKHMQTSSEKRKRDPPKLVSGESFDLYRSHMIVPAKSDVIVDFDLVLEIVTGGSKETIPFKGRASSTAPDEPDWLGKKEFIPHAMEITKDTCILKIDDFAKIQVDISWFNDLTAASNIDGDHTLWGYNDGDCDYEDYVWADRQEVDWDNLEEEPELERF